MLFVKTFVFNVTYIDQVFAFCLLRDTYITLELELECSRATGVPRDNIYER